MTNAAVLSEKKPPSEIKIRLYDLNEVEYLFNLSNFT